MGESAAGEEDALAEVSDEVLVERAVDGDTIAFAELIRRHGPILRAYARRLLGSAAEADEVAQEAFYRGWRELASLQERGAVRGWLFGLVTRLSVAQLRDAPRTAVDPEEPSCEDAASPRRARSAALSAVLDALPADERHCWLLHEMGGLDHAEIAESLGLSADEVRGCLARARAGVYARMEEWR